MRPIIKSVTRMTVGPHRDNSKSNWTGLLVRLADAPVMCHAVVPRVRSVRKKCFIQIVRHTIERTTSMRARAYMCGRALKNQTRTHVNMLIRSLINILTCHMYMVHVYKFH